MSSTLTARQEPRPLYFYYPRQPREDSETEPRRCISLENPDQRGDFKFEARSSLLLKNSVTDTLRAGAPGGSEYENVYFAGVTFPIRKIFFL